MLKIGHVDQALQVGKELLDDRVDQALQVRKELSDDRVDQALQMGKGNVGVLC